MPYGPPSGSEGMRGNVALVERARKEFNVPGIAVAVVKDGHVVELKGYGTRRLGNPTPVILSPSKYDPATLCVFLSAAKEPLYFALVCSVPLRQIRVKQNNFL